MFHHGSHFNPRNESAIHQLRAFTNMLAERHAELRDIKITGCWVKEDKLKGSNGGQAIFTGTTPQSQSIAIEITKDHESFEYRIRLGKGERKNIERKVETISRIEDKEWLRLVEEGEDKFLQVEIPGKTFLLRSGRIEVRHRGNRRPVTSEEKRTIYATTMNLFKQRKERGAEKSTEYMRLITKAFGNAPSK